MSELAIYVFLLLYQWDEKIIAKEIIFFEIGKIITAVLIVSFDKNLFIFCKKIMN